MENLFHLMKIDSLVGHYFMGQLLDTNAKATYNELAWFTKYIPT